MTDSEFVVFTRKRYEAAIEEMAGNMFHGGWLTKQALGPPLENVLVVELDEDGTV